MVPDSFGLSMRTKRRKLARRSCQREGGDMSALGPFVIIVIVALYLLPAIIAFRRECRSDAAIFVFNLVLGWTVFGWLLALAWALGGRIRGSIWPTEIVARVRVIERTPDAQ